MDGMRTLGWWCLPIALALACGGDPPANDSSSADGSSTSSGSTGSTSSGTSTTSTGTGATTTAGTTATGSETSGGSESGAATTTTGTATADASTGDTGATSTATTDTTSATTGAGACEPLPNTDGWSCQYDEDCAIAGDCCGCTAYNPDMGFPGNCGGGCGQDVCEQLGLDMAVCVDGFCEVYGLSCDQTAVTCESLPPDCAVGSLPQVAGDCWTQACLPIEYCDWVPDCSACPGDQICLIVQTESCDHVDCFDPIPECGNAPSCACEGEIMCPEGYPSCAMMAGAIVCS